MGSIQAMLLILRIACVLKRFSLETRRKHDFLVDDRHADVYWPPTMRNILELPPTIIIEEPELNLHPALQSKLADFFHELYDKFHINLLVETHSEYILRKSQVIVAENELAVAPNESPFRVYYFPKETYQEPYRLEYREDGSFDRNFGDGFFDEASSSTLELLKLKRQKKS
jgi:predicted ATPase